MYHNLSLALSKWLPEIKTIKRVYENMGNKDFVLFSGYSGSNSGPINLKAVNKMNISLYIINNRLMLRYENITHKKFTLSSLLGPIADYQININISGRNGFTLNIDVDYHTS